MILEIAIFTCVLLEYLNTFVLYFVYVYKYTSLFTFSSFFEIVEHLSVFYLNS